jgi:hypothetical protein
MKEQPGETLVPKIVQEGETYHISFTREQFRSFVSSVLGKPQTISGHFHGGFEIRVSDLKNLHHAISQRISQQHKDAMLTQFTARVSFDDDSSVTLEDLDGLESHAEIKPVSTVGVYLTWKYLVQFPDHSNPEVQHIEFGFFAGSPSVGRIVPFAEGYFVMIGFPDQFGSTDGLIHYSISHTERTWGEDMKNLAINWSKNHLVSASKFKKIVNRHRKKIGSTLAALVVVVTLASGFKHLQGALGLDLSTATFAIVADAVRQSTEALYTAIAGVFIFTIVATFVRTWILNEGRLSSPGHILLTSGDDRRKAKLERKQAKRVVSFVAASMVALLISVFANYVFSIVNRYLGSASSP